MTACIEPKAALPDYYKLLEQAVSEPGEVSAANRYFRQYSLTNRWLASTQLRNAGLPLAPINTFKGWLTVKRSVQKGQKAAVALIMPVPVKAKRKDSEGAESDDKEILFTKFMLRNYWFHLGQTEGEVFEPVASEQSDWQLSAAMEFLGITEDAFAFKSVSDTRLGTAVGKSIAISPLDMHPELGRIRQMAHVVLGHTADEPAKSVPTCTELRTVEAETTAYLVAATFGLSGMAECRAAIQHNLEGGSKIRIPDKCANRAFSAADKIINAGYC